MKTILRTLMLYLLIFQPFLTLPALAADEFNVGDNNRLYFRIFENIYDSEGNYKSPVGGTLEVGDHFVGVVDFQNIMFEGSDIWNKSNTDQITGIFVQRVEAINTFPNDPFDLNQDTQDHVVLGQPTLTDFCKGADCIYTSSLLDAGEMLALYRQTGGAATPFTYGGTLSSDVSNATDGDKWLSFGYQSGQDGIFGSPQPFVDDDGYAYSHAVLGTDLINLVGEAFGGLNTIVNNTGYDFCAINDINEGEVGRSTIYTNTVFTAEIEVHENSVLFPGGFSQWDFNVNDPATLFPCEGNECRVTGGGVDEFGDIVSLNGAIMGKYTFGGQVGAPTASQPQPSGEWTHAQHGAKSFTFHGGTSSSPKGNTDTEIISVVCSDLGYCDPARPAPNKQIDFDGVGTFTNVKKFPSNSNPFPEGQSHFFYVHIEDIGEPGPGEKNRKTKCEHVPFTPVTDGDCVACADYYLIEIHENENPASPIIYSAAGFIDGGNLQIHPTIK